jgi:hypothetical protein
MVCLPKSAAGGTDLMENRECLHEMLRTSYCVIYVTRRAATGPVAGLNAQVYVCFESANL